MKKILPQPKFLAVEVNTKLEKKTVTLLLIFFSIFSQSSCYAISVGDSYGGGTVFCVSQTPDITKCIPEGSGDYGLIMANEDQVNYDSNHKHGITWSSECKKAGALSDDDGAANTAAIIAVHPNDTPSNNAAWLCHNYRDKEGHTDWYLPSKNELNKMYIYAYANNLIGKGCSGSREDGIQCLVGGYREEWKAYWSSTEYFGFSNDACSHSFSNGYQDANFKLHYYFAVRAIRAFSNLAIQPVISLCTSLPQVDDSHLLLFTSGMGQDTSTNCE